MKKSLLVSVISLALVLSSAGLCFADSALLDYPDTPVTFTEVPSNRSFYRIDRSALSTDPFTPTLLFNDVYAYYTNAVYFVHQGNVSDPYNFGNTTIYCCSGLSTGFWLVASTQSNLSFNSAPSTSNAILFNGNNLMLNDIGIVRNTDASVLVGESTVTERFLYSMPSGYLLKLSSTASFSVDRRFYSVMNSTYNYLHLKDNSAGSDGVTDFRENGAFHGVVSSSSLVNGATLGTIFTGTGNEVPWQPTNANIFGRATDYSYLGTQSWTVPVGLSFVIWYPYYYGLSDPDINEPDISLNLLISHTQPLTVEVIKIQADSTVYDNSVIVTSSLTGDSTTGSQTESGDDQITITTTNTPTGGGNAGDAPLSDNTSVLGVLSRLTNLITGLFHDAIDAIQSLVNTGSSFMQVVAGMFSWLPPELLGILTSALVVIIVVGVVKLLL